MTLGVLRVSVVSSSLSDFAVRERLGPALQVLGLLLMPLALYEGFREGGSFGAEIVIAFVGFLLTIIGGRLRGGGRRK